MAESTALIQQLATSTLALLAGADTRLPMPFGRDIVLLSCTVAGTSHRDLDAVEPDLALGQELVLRREPENPHDALAIRVQRSDGALLGYVPRRKNEVLSRLMDAGKLLVGRLMAKEREEGWLRLEVEVSLREI